MTNCPEKHTVCPLNPLDQSPPGVCRSFQRSRVKPESDKCLFNYGYMQRKLGYKYLFPIGFFILNFYWSKSNCKMYRTVLMLSAISLIH